MQETSVHETVARSGGIRIMKQLCILAFLFLFALNVSGQKANTFVVGTHDLEMHKRLGDHK